MALKIRLRRMGRKDAPTYRIVVAESSMPRDGRFVTSLGHYNPRTEPMTLVVNRDEALKWMAKGAMPTDTARSLLKRAGVFGPAPVETPVDSAVETVKKAASKVVEAVKDAAEEVRDRITGADEEEPAAAAPAAEATAAEEEEKPAGEGQEG